MISQALFFLIIAALLLCLRFLYILPFTNRSAPLKKARLHGTHLLIVLGSGGHTAEILRLLSSLKLWKYSHRTFVVTSGDAFSAKKAVEFERHMGGGGESRGTYSVHEIHRARAVGQSWLTTPLDCIKCFRDCLRVTRGRGNLGPPDVVVCNGPGTAVFVAVGCLIYKFLGESATRIIYVESFARVNSLSLSGKILYNLVDRFLVQWPTLAEKFPRAEYHGILV